MPKTIKRRRAENKTDYNARLAMLKSGKRRLVVRKTNKYIIAQIIDSDHAQDKILVGANSKELLGKGWPKENSGSLKSRAAAYLTGYLLGSKADKKEDLIVDIGLQRHISKSRICAVIKGAVDSGLKISHDPEALPEVSEVQVSEKLKDVFSKVLTSLGGGK
jgi:large subunit ribosomal protein L18